MTKIWYAIRAFFLIPTIVKFVEMLFAKMKREEKKKELDEIGEELKKEKDGDSEKRQEIARKLRDNINDD